MVLITDKFKVEYKGAEIYEDGYEEDEFMITLLERNELCYVAYDYVKNYITTIEAWNQNISSGDELSIENNYNPATETFSLGRNICTESGRDVRDVHEDIERYDFEIRTIFRFMHDLGYFSQQ